MKWMVSKKSKPQKHPLDEEMVPAQVTTATLAQFVRNKSQRGLSPLENQLASLSDGIAERLQKMEGNINLNDIRIEKLEEQMDHMPTQLLQMQFTPRSTVTEVMKTMVVGGLQSLQTLDAATQ